jgi:4-alpha-glucanotransferase
VNEDAVVIGEVWEDASNKISYGVRKEYFLGFELDSVMNYPFKNALIDFLLGRIPASRFDREMQKLRENYPQDCFYSLMNLVGSHDAPRILTVLSEPPSDLTPDQKAMHRPTQRHRALGLKRLMAAAFVQMTFPGVPCVYYGDEAGLTGFDDPFNRACYPWGNVNEELLAWYRQAIALRNAFAPFRTGTFEAAWPSVGACDEVYAFVRAIRGRKDAFGQKADNGFALVAVNRDQEAAREVEFELSGWNLPRLSDPFAPARPAAAIPGAPAIGAGAASGNPGPGFTFARGVLRFTLPPLGCRAFTFPEVALPPT